MSANPRVMVFLLAVVLIMLSVIDIIAGLLGFVPVVGDVFASLSETLLEVIQAIGILILAIVGGLS